MRFFFNEHHHHFVCTTMCMLIISPPTCAALLCLYHGLLACLLACFFCFGQVSPLVCYETGRIRKVKLIDAVSVGPTPMAVTMTFITAPAGTIAVPDPAAVIIPVFTGLVLVNVADTAVATPFTNKVPVIITPAGIAMVVPPDSSGKAAVADVLKLTRLCDSGIVVVSGSTIGYGGGGLLPHGGSATLVPGVRVNGRLRKSRRPPPPLLMVAVRGVGAKIGVPGAGLLVMQQTSCLCSLRCLAQLIGDVVVLVFLFVAFHSTHLQAEINGIISWIHIRM